MNPSLREIRTNLQWTQERMAREMSTSLRTYSRWESGMTPKRVMLHAGLIEKNKPLARPVQDPA